MGTIMNIRRGGGATGCTLEVTGVKTGDTVLLQKGDKSYTKTLDSDKKAMFRGLTGGTWTAKMSDGIQNVQREVEITDNYELTMRFFAATINVTYPAGSTCTCTFSYEGETIKTYTAPDTSGSYTFTVSIAADWVVSCTNGTQTASKTVSITQDEQAETVELSYKDYLLNGETQTYAFTAHAQAVNKNAPSGEIGSVASDSNGTTLTGSWNGVWATDKVIDLTEFDSLVFDVTVNSMTGWGGFTGVFDATGYWDGGQIAAINSNNLHTGENIIDVSDITGLHRVGIAWYGSLNLTFHAIYRK